MTDATTEVLLQEVRELQTGVRNLGVLSTRMGEIERQLQTLQGFTGLAEPLSLISGWNETSTVHSPPQGTQIGVGQILLAGTGLAFVKPSHSPFLRLKLSGAFANVDMVVDSNGSGTHTTLGAAITAAALINGNTAIWVCSTHVETISSSITFTPSYASQHITIGTLGQQRPTFTVTVADAVFKLKGNSTRFTFSNLAFSRAAGSGSNAFITGNGASSSFIPYLEFDNCYWDDGGGAHWTALVDSFTTGFATSDIKLSRCTVLMGTGGSSSILSIGSGASGTGEFQLVNNYIDVDYIINKNGASTAPDGYNSFLVSNNHLIIHHYVASLDLDVPTPGGWSFNTNNIDHYGNEPLVQFNAGMSNPYQRTLSGNMYRANASNGAGNSTQFFYANQGGGTVENIDCSGNSLYGPGGTSVAITINGAAAITSLFINSYRNWGTNTAGSGFMNTIVGNTTFSGGTVSGLNHNLLSLTHSDTTAAAVSAGALIRGNAAGTAWEKLVKSTDGFILTLVAGVPAWAAAGAGGTTILVNEDGVNVDSATTLNFIEPDATLVTDSPAGTARIDMSKYLLLAGRAGGQTAIGGTAASQNLLLQSTANATRGVVGIVDNAYGLGYLDIGSAVAPLNTTAGDLTAIRINAGNNEQTFQFGSPALQATGINTLVGAGANALIYGELVTNPAGNTTAEMRVLNFEFRPSTNFNYTLADGQKGIVVKYRRTAGTGTDTRFDAFRTISTALGTGALTEYNAFAVDNSSAGAASFNRSLYSPHSGMAMLHGGHIGAGNGASPTADVNTVLSVIETFTNPSTDALGYNSTITKTITSANAFGAGGLQVNARVSGAFADTGLIIGVGSSLTRLTNSAAAVSADFRNYTADVAVNTGATVTLRTGYLVNEKSGSGTLVNQYGIDIAALTGATTLNVGIRNASNIRQTGYLSVRGSTTTPLNTTDGDISAKRIYIGAIDAYISPFAAFIMGDVGITGDMTLDGTLYGVDDSGLTLSSTGDDLKGFIRFGEADSEDLLTVWNEAENFWGFGTEDPSYTIDLWGTMAMNGVEMGPYSVVQYVFTPDAAPAGVVVAGNQQGMIHHSGPNAEVATRLYVDAETAPGAAGLPITIQYGDSDDLDTVVNWTTIVTMTLSSQFSQFTDTMTTGNIPANRLLRLNVGTIVGSPTDVTITLRVKRPLSA